MKNKKAKEKSGICVKDLDKALKTRDIEKLKK